MTDAVDTLLSILDLETIDRDLYRGVSPATSWKRVFGGQVVAQALVAACRSVEGSAGEGRMPHSLHAYFLLAGDPTIPILYEAERIRDGRSFTTRRVVAKQRGEAIFAMSVSFQTAEDGFDHQASAPAAPAPETLPGREQVATEILPQLPAGVRAYFTRERALELRPANFGRYIDAAPDPSASFQVWLRTLRALPDDPLLHAAILAYASDMTLLDVALVPHGTSVFDARIQAASLDHALWFHRPFRIDDWLLYAQDSPSASGARGFSRGAIHDRQGRLVASVAQEGLIRVKRGQA
jgi:acyl-CoA thioesterase II